jgi:hypothetical protein
MKQPLVLKVLKSPLLILQLLFAQLTLKHLLLPLDFLHNLGCLSLSLKLIVLLFKSDFYCWQLVSTFLLVLGDLGRQNCFSECLLDVAVVMKFDQVLIRNKFRPFLDLLQFDLLHLYFCVFSHSVGGLNSDWFLSWSFFVRRCKI